MAGTQPLSARPMQSRFIMAEENITVKIKGLRQMLDTVDAIPHILKEESENLAMEIGEIAVREMQNVVETSGTAFSRAAYDVGLNMSPTGRVRTGRMFNSIAYRINSSIKNTRVTFGYMKDVKKYFKMQEFGFENIYRASYDGGVLRLKSSGQPRVFPRKEPITTEGMFSIQAAQAEIDLQLPALRKKYRMRVTKRSRGSL